MALAIIGSAIPNIINADIKDVKNEISKQAGKDLVLAEIATEIARAESGFEEDATNPKSTATGIYQFLIGTWKHYKCEGTRLDARDNITCALDVMKKRGFRDWSSSRYIKGGWWAHLSLEARLRVSGASSAMVEPTEMRIVSFAGGIIRINLKGSILDHSGNLFNGGKIPFI